MSTVINFKKIHAFADNTYPGNPAAYVSTEKELPDEVMQRFAKELEGFVSEVVYITPGNAGIDFNLRYFSCECEVPFCGHGTLATINYEMENNPHLQEKELIKIQTAKGILDIENKYNECQSVFIYAPEKEKVESNIVIPDLAAALNIAPDLISTNMPVEIYNAGQNTLIVPLQSSKDVIACSPDYSVLRQFCFENNCAIVNIFSTDTTLADSSYRTRVFAPTFGYLEDPATGSGNSALAYYLEDNKSWNGENLDILQGTSLSTPNIVYLRKPSSDNRKVMFGGKAILKLEGKYYLQDI